MFGGNKLCPITKGDLRFYMNIRGSPKLQIIDGGATSMLVGSWFLQKLKFLKKYRYIL